MCRDFMIVTRIRYNKVLGQIGGIFSEYYVIDTPFKKRSVTLVYYLICGTAKSEGCFNFESTFAIKTIPNCKIYYIEAH